MCCAAVVLVVAGRLIDDIGTGVAVTLLGRLLLLLTGVCCNMTGCCCCSSAVGAATSAGGLREAVGGVA
jgi:hypothetical protein